MQFNCAPRWRRTDEVNNIIVRLSLSRFHFGHKLRHNYYYMEFYHYLTSREIVIVITCIFMYRFPLLVLYRQPYTTPTHWLHTFT